MKRITLIILSVATILAGSVSCQKVNDLDKRLTQLEQTVSDLKAQVLAGAVITSVDKTADGCTFILSNGQSYTVTNGKNGSDGEAIIAHVEIEENFIVLTLKDGETLRISYQNPLSMVTLSIVPDYDDGTVQEPNTTEYNGEKSTIFYLDIEVTPAKYAEILSDTERFIHKAVFSPVQTKSDFGNAVTVSPKRMTYCEGAPIPFLEAYFELDDDTAALLQNKNTPYTVSYSIEDKDGVYGAATAFVAISNDKGSGGDNPTDNVVPYTLTGTPSPTEGGSVTFTKGGTTATVAYFGDEITIVSTPNEFYEVSSVSAVDASDGSVTITDNTFTMPASNVTVTTTFAKKSFGITKTDVAVTGGSFKVKKGDDEVTSAQWGETIKVEVTTPQYYAVDEIKAYKTGESTPTVTVNADGTFTMPKYAVTIEVTFTPDGSVPPTEMPETIGL